MLNTQGNMPKIPSNEDIVYATVLQLTKKGEEANFKSIQRIAGLRDSELESTLADLEGDGAIKGTNREGIIIYKPAETAAEKSKGQTFYDWNVQHPESAYTLNGLR